MNSLGWVLSAYAANVYSLFVTFGVAAGKRIHLLADLIFNFPIGNVGKESSYRERDVLSPSSHATLTLPSRKFVVIRDVKYAFS